MERCLRLGYKKLQVALDFRGAFQVVTQPPPNSNPGPSDARKIGFHLSGDSFVAAASARCRAVPHVEDPRFPETRETSGNSVSETPHCLATKAIKRGFGWCVAKAPTAAREIPLRCSSAAMVFSMRLMAARDSASPSNCSVKPPSLSSLTLTALA